MPRPPTARPGQHTPPPATGNAPLQRYRQKRDFARTPEPAPDEKPRRKAPSTPQALRFVIQKHAATRLHYDFRLELDGVLVSWAVPKGPSFDATEKRMAVHVEDHPVSYGDFEGTIPEKQYGAGHVIVWDKGTWEPVGDARQGLAGGKLVFRLHGQKLAGLWELVRIAKPGDRQDAWLLFKKRDEWARPLAEYDVIAALPDSVLAQPLGLLEARETRRAAAGRSTTPPLAPADLPGAKKARLPATLAPQLATVSKDMPPGGEWVYEIKFDGYRLMTRIDKGRARLITRGGHDWTGRMPRLAHAVEALGLDSAWLDGEIVVLGPQGTPDFNALQNAFDHPTQGSGTQAITYFVFDLPFSQGLDLRATPLKHRRALLRQLLSAHADPQGPVRLSDDFPADPHAMVQTACALGLEGVIAKRADAPYVSARTDTWLKLKCQLRQEFVIGGFTPRMDSPREVGSLLLGVHDEQGLLLHAGSVGTGWSTATARDLYQRLAPLQQPDSPFKAGTVRPGRWSRRTAGAERWVRPDLVAEVAFAEWTPDGHIRHASFKGLREDKPAREVRREGAALPMAPVHGAAPAAGARSRERAPQVAISHPERIIDPSTGITKLELVRYYESVAAWMLPHLRGRPASLVRAPDGIAGQLFFQKHTPTPIPGMTQLDPALWPGHAALLAVDNEQALLQAAQLNVIEFHTWNAVASRIGQPDRVIFDLDPGEGTPWQRVQEAALLTRTLLDELGLVSFLKTSGGKGLHVVVPLTPDLGWDEVKAFSQAVVQHLARTIPDRFVAKSGGSNRVGKIFADYLRNGHGATTAAAFSARARPGMGVSMPVAWGQLDELKSGAQWTVRTAREYLSFQALDPWKGYGEARQTLKAALAKLSRGRRG